MPLMIQETGLLKSGIKDNSNTVGIWIANWFGIQMVQNSSLVEWFVIQVMAWIANYKFIYQDMAWITN